MDFFDSPGAAAIDVSAAIDSAIGAHASQSPSHLVDFYTPNTLGLDAGKWSKIASGQIGARYGEVAGEILINGNGSNTITWTRGRIRFRVRQQAALGSAPLAFIELLDGADISPADIALRTTDDGGNTKYTINIRVTRAYEWLTFTPLWLETRNANHVWTGCTDFAASLVAASYGTLFAVQRRFSMRQEVAAAIAAGAERSDVLVFPTPYADTNYSAQVSPEGGMSFCLMGITGSGREAGQVTIRTRNSDPSASRTPTIHLTVTHD